MICAIACANAARTPLLVLASNMAIFQEDTEAGIQLGYQQPTTEGLKKYGKRLINPRRVHEYAGYAFRQLRSGVPKPVHLDFPRRSRVRASSRTRASCEFYHDKTRYRTESRPHPSPKDIAKAVDLIKTARAADHRLEQRRLLRQGVGRAEAARREGADSGRRVGRDEGTVLRRAARSRPTRRRARWRAPTSSILVGQHCMPTVGEFAFGPDAKYIRIDQAAEDIGRNMPIDLGIVSCEKAALEALADAVPAMTHDAWIAEIAAARQEVRGSERSITTRPGSATRDAVHPAVIAQRARRLPLQRQDPARSRRPSRRAATGSRATCAASCAATGPDRS